MIEYAPQPTPESSLAGRRKRQDLIHLLDRRSHTPKISGESLIKSSATRDNLIHLFDRKPHGLYGRIITNPFVERQRIRKFMSEATDPIPSHPADPEQTAAKEQREIPETSVAWVMKDLHSTPELADAHRPIRMSRLGSPEYQRSYEENRAGWANESEPSDEVLDFSQYENHFKAIHERFGHTMTDKTQMTYYNPTQFGDKVIVRSEFSDDEFSAVSVVCERKEVTDQDGNKKVNLVPMMQEREDGTIDYAAVLGQDPRLQVVKTSRGDRYVVNVVEAWKQTNGEGKEEANWQQMTYSGPDLFHLTKVKKGKEKMKDIEFEPTSPLESDVVGSVEGENGLLEDLEVFTRPQSHFEEREERQLDGTVKKVRFEVGQKGSFRGKIGHFTIHADKERGLSGWEVFEQMSEEAYHEKLESAPLLALQPEDDEELDEAAQKEGRVAKKGEWVGANGIEKVNRPLFDYTKEDGEKANYADELGLTDSDLRGWLLLKYHKAGFKPDDKRKYDLGQMLYRKAHVNRFGQVIRPADIVNIGTVLSRGDFRPGPFKLTRDEMGKLTEQQKQEVLERAAQGLPAEVGGDLEDVTFGNPDVKNEEACVATSDYEIRYRKIPGIKKRVAEGLQRYKQLRTNPNQKAA